jgi:4-hydroxybenzoate polyprenyltransferase
LRSLREDTLASRLDIAAPSIPVRVEPPLCVDLDGTLVKSDTLMDGLCLFAQRFPLEIWRVPLWLAGGRARLKSEISGRIALDPARLPYNAPLLQYLQEQRREGRELVLATGADSDIAKRIAGHLGIFDGVVASDATTNLTRTKKLARLKDRFGAFDYIGNSRADLPLLKNARVAMVANPSFGLKLGLRVNGIQVAGRFRDRRPWPRTFLKAVRIHQWAKNILLFAPLLLSHRVTPASASAAILAFFCFSFMASANYLLNDMLDVENDRRHSTKRLRPFAAGDLSIAGGVAMVAVLVVAALAILPVLPSGFGLWLALYIAGSLSYSFYLKQIPVVDVLLLSGLYTLRLLAGGAATSTVISQWLAGFSTFLFLSLAMVKRFSELENLRERGATVSHGRGYSVGDMEQIRSFGTSSATAAVVVFMLYIGRQDVTMLYRHAMRLWLIVPLLIYWLFRVWLVASRGELDDDPVVFALQDRVSLLLGVLVIAIAFLAT